MAAGKYGFTHGTFKDCIVPAPSAHSGAGEFKNPVDAQGPTAQPIKPVQFANISAKAPESGIGKKK